MAQVSEGHLTPEARQRLGPPDLVLRLGDTRFPAHRGLIQASSGVLASLLKECGTSGGEQVQVLELSLASSQQTSSQQVSTSGPWGPSSQGPTAAAAVTTEQLQLYLGQLYSSSALRLEGEQQALDLLRAADYLDSPSLFCQADVALALHVHSQLVAESGLTSSRVLRPKLPSSKLAEFLALASKHRLRRLMAACLPLLWALEPVSRSAALASIDPAVLSLFMQVMSTWYDDANTIHTCGDDACKCEFSPAFLTSALKYCGNGYYSYCDHCRLHQEVEWRRAAVEIERELAVKGWGAWP